MVSSGLVDRLWLRIPDVLPASVAGIFRGGCTSPEDTIYIDASREGLNQYICNFLSYEIHGFVNSQVEVQKIVIQPS
jgi:hypothetical protein